MKKLFSLLVVAMIIVSCKKDVGSNDPGTNNSFDIAGSTVVTSMPANSRINGYLLDSGVIARPDSGSNLRFDYANVPNNQAWNDSLKIPFNTIDYPQAKYMSGFNQVIAGQPLSTNEYFGLSTGNWTDLGGYFSPGQTFTQSGFTVDVPQQANKNMPVQTLVNFPVKYLDLINESIHSTFNINIKGNFNGIPFNGPLQIATGSVVNSKNTGYGYLKLRGYTDSLKTVVQRYTTATTTTFSSTNLLINSLLPVLLSQLGISNGQTITTTVYRFWIKDKGLVMTREANGSARVRTGL